MNRLAYMIGRIVGFAFYPVIFLMLAYAMWHLAKAVH